MTHERIPQTLARIAGLSAAPADPRDAVLLLIDTQLEYTIGRLPLAGVDAAVAEGARLLEYARSSGLPVIHAIHHGKPGAAAFDPLGRFVDFIPALAPQ